MKGKQHAEVLKMTKHSIHSGDLKFPMSSVQKQKTWKKPEIPVGHHCSYNYGSTVSPGTQRSLHSGIISERVVTASWLQVQPAA